MLERHEAIREVVLPTLGPERRATYSPILPISPRTGRVLQVPIEECRPAAGTVVFRDEDGSLTEVPVTDGHCKMQWKCDWALRWAALDVDYEMSGKDLIDSVKLSTQICRVLDGAPPEGFTYELFLDEQGQKISKSKGNGLTIEEWLRYGTRESLQLFLYREPRKAKRLHFDVIPRNVDDYERFLDAFPRQLPAEQVGNPLWHIHDGQPPVDDRLPAGPDLRHAAQPRQRRQRRRAGGALGLHRPLRAGRHARRPRRGSRHWSSTRSPTTGTSCGRPGRYRAPTDQERAALEELRDWLGGAGPSADAEAMQYELYEIGKRHGFANLRDWFKALYEVLLGQSEGPRFGTFVAIYGTAKTRALIEAGAAPRAAAA